MEEAGCVACAHEYSNTDLTPLSISETPSCQPVILIELISLRDLKTLSLDKKTHTEEIRGPSETRAQVCIWTVCPNQCFGTTDVSPALFEPNISNYSYSEHTQRQRRRRQGGAFLLWCYQRCRDPPTRVPGAQTSIIIS